MSSLDPLNPPSEYLTFDMALSLFNNENVASWPGADVIAMDTETNGQDVRDGRGWCVGISVAARFGGLVLSTYIPFRHTFGANYDSVALTQLTHAIEHYDGWLVFHNAKFDLESLRTIGINYIGKFYDTMLMSHLTNENRYSQALDSLAQRVLGDSGKKQSEIFLAIKKAMGWEGIPSYVMFEYAAYDAYLTLLLYEALLPDFLAEKLDEDIWPRKQKFVNLVKRMERWGVRIETNLCEHYIAIGEMQMDEIVELLGMNPGSHKDQLHLFLEVLQLPILKKSKKTGKPSFDKEVMEQYEEILERRSGDTTAELVLAYRGWQKSVSSNYKPYLDLLSPDGRLRPNYKLHGTKTGRSSCEKPNLQQIPRSGDKPWNGRLKKCFIAEDGYTLWEADYAQLELRLGTAYAHEEKLLEIFADETRDVFTEMSKQVGMVRFDTKTLTYSMQYGAGVNRIKNVFSVSEARAREIRENYFLTYPRFKAIAQLASRRAVVAGKIRLWSGRYRHFFDRQAEKHKAFNSAIQGGAADIVERTMVRLDEGGCNTEECRMLLMVHDSVVFEIKNGCEEEYLPKIKQLMENVEPDFGVKFKVEVKKWGE